VLFAGFWLATIVAVPFAWQGGIPGPLVALLLRNCLIAGALMSWWHGKSVDRAYSAGSRIGFGAFVGSLFGEITCLVTKGGAVDELFGWMRGWPPFWTMGRGD